MSKAPCHWAQHADAVIRSFVDVAGGAGPMANRVADASGGSVGVGIYDMVMGGAATRY